VNQLRILLTSIHPTRFSVSEHPASERHHVAGDTSLNHSFFFSSTSLFMMKKFLQQSIWHEFSFRGIAEGARQKRSGAAFAFVFLMLVTGLQMATAQSTANYTFSTNTTGSLIADANGNAIDMTLGTVQVAASVDQGASAVLNLPFTFIMNGNVHTQYSVSSNGACQLGATAIGTAIYVASAGTTALPRFAAFAADMATSTTGSVKTLTVGTAPNRCVVIQWTNMLLYWTNTVPEGTFQARLYENGTIEYVYGNMSVAGSSSVTGSTGFSTNTTSGNMAFVTTATNTNSTTASSTNTYAFGSVITNLHSPVEGSRRVYRYVPVSGLVEPTSLALTAATATGMTLNWTAPTSTTGVVKYALFTSVDNVNFNYFNATALGTTTLAATGLTPGTLYYWRVYSMSEGTLSSLYASGSLSTLAAATYTWNAAGGTGAFTLGTNWTPTRTVAPTDILIIDGTITPVATLTGLTTATGTCGQLIVKNNATATISATTAATIAISGGSGDDFSVESGSTLQIGATAATVVITTSFTAVTPASSMNIAGTLTLASGAVHVLNFTNTVSTVSGTLNLNHTSQTITSTAANLSFANGSNCNMNGQTTTVTVPLATWGTTSTLKFSGITTATGVTNGTTQNFGNVTYNCAAATATMSMFTTSILGIKGNLTIQATNTGKFRITTSSVGLPIGGNLNISGGTCEIASTTGIVNVAGNVNLSGGTLDITAGTSAATLNVVGNFVQTGGTLNASAGTAAVVQFKGTVAQNLTLTTVGTGVINYVVNNTAGVNLTGNLPINSGAKLTITAGNLSGTGAVAYNATASTLVYNSTLANQTANATEFPLLNPPVSLTINNTFASGSVSVPFTRSLGGLTGVLTLTAGILDNTDYTITVPNSAAAAVVGGSATSYIKGQLVRALPTAAVASIVYPVGKSAYAPYELVYTASPVVTFTTSTSTTLGVEAKDGATGGMLGTFMQALNTSRYWATSVPTGAITAFNSIKLTDPNIGNAFAIAGSATLTGAYGILGGTSPVPVISGNSITSSVANITTGMPAFLVLGELAAPVITSLVAATGSTPPLTGNQCVAVPRTVTAVVTPGGGAVVGVSLNYALNGGSVVSSPMSNTTGNTWVGTIPASGNSNVTFYVVATDAVGLQKNGTGTAYADEPLTGLVASVTATPATICAGTSTTLKSKLEKLGSVAIGAGATTASGYSNPFYSNWANNKNQTLYLASELQAAGFKAGNITALSLNVISGTTALSGFNINMGHTTASVMTTTAFLTPTMTNVYSAATQTPVVGANLMTFSTPFDWDGTSNVVIQFCWDNTTSTATISNSVTADVTGFVSCVSYNRTSTTGINICTGSFPTPSATSYSTRPKITFTGNQAISPTAYNWSGSAGTTSSVTVSPTVTTPYTVTITAASCDVTATGTVTVNTVAQPTANPGGHCGSNPSTSTVTSNTGAATPSYKWYSALTGGTPIQTGVSATAPNVTVTTDFYVSEYNAVTGCESYPRVLVTETVIVPEQLTAAASVAAVCPGGNIDLTVTQAQTAGAYVYNYTYTWSSSVTGNVTSAAGGVTTATVTAIASPTTSGVKTYTVEGFEASSGCVASASVTVTASPVPIIVSTVANPTTVCDGGNTQLTVTTSGITNGTKKVGAGTLLSSTYPNPYYTGYWSSRHQFIYTAAELTAAGLLAGPMTSLAFHVGTSTAMPLTNYAVSIGNATNPSATTLTAFQATGLTTVFTSPLYNVVASSANTHTFTTPFVWDGTSSIVVQTCFANNSFTGANQIEYTTTTGNTAIYYREDAGGSCVSTLLSGSSTSRPNITFGGNIIGNNASDYSYAWSPATSSTTAVTTATVSATSPTYTVTATITATGCKSTSAVTVAVNPLPPAPTDASILLTPNGTAAFPSSVQCGTAVPALSVNGGSGASFRWYADPTGGTALTNVGGGTMTGSTYTGAAISMSKTFYVSQISAAASGSCEGPRVALYAYVADPDPIAIATSSSSICLGAPIVLSATKVSSVNGNAYAYTWAATPSAGSGMTSSVIPAVLANGDAENTTVTPTIAGSYTYSVTADDSGGCVLVSSVTVNVGALPVINPAPTATPSTICEGGTVQLVAQSLGTPVTRKIGAGTTMSSTYPNPYYTNYWSSRHQFIYTAAELTAAGLSAGIITSLAFHVGTSTALPLTNYAVSIGNATIPSATTLSAFQATGLTTVFTSPSYNVIASAVNTHTFTTPFIWDGTSSIVVQTCFSNSSFTGSNQIEYTTTTGNTAIFYREDSPGAACSSTVLSTGTYTARPNITFSNTPSSTNSYTWAWSPTTATATANTTATPTAAVTSYTVSATNAATGCYTTATVPVTVKVVPTTPILTSGVASPWIQCGTAVPGSSVESTTSALSTHTYNWYTGPTGGTPIVGETGAALSAYTVSSTTTLYVSEVNGTCESARVAVPISVSIADPIAASVNATPITKCLGLPIDLSVALASGTAAYTYTWAAAGATSGLTAPLTGAAQTITPTAAGTYTYNVSGFDGVCANTASVIVTITAGPAISSVSATPSQACVNGTIGLEAQSIGPVATVGTIGAGASTSTLAAANPFYGGYGGVKTQYIIKASELTAAGYIAGNISALGIDITTVGASLTGFNVAIGSTALTALTTTIQSGLTDVFSADPFIPVLNINTFTFTSPYYWDGTSNVILQFCWSNGNTSNTASTVKVDASGFTSSNARYVDSQLAVDVCSYTGAGSTTSTSRPKFTITGIKLGNKAADYAWAWSPTTSSATAVTTATLTVVPTTFTVTATNSVTGCTTTATKEVTAATDPLAVTGTASATQCPSVAKTIAATVTGGCFPYTYAWGLNGTTVATTASFSVTPTSTGTYILTATDNSGSTITHDVTLTVNNPTPTVTAPPAQCATSATFALSATPSNPANTLRWYAGAVGGPILATSNTYTTPAITATTDYYVDEIEGTFAANLGNTTIPSTTGASAQRGIVFTASQNATLISAQYYSPTLNVTNGVTVVLTNHTTGVIVTTLPVQNIVQGATAGWYTMNLNLPVVAGTSYRLLATFTSSVNRVSTGVDYASATFNNLGAFGTITSGYDGGVTAASYNYFHNIVMGVGLGCTGTRVPVTATLTPPPALTLSSASASTCAGFPSAAVTVTSTIANYDTYTWLPSGPTGDATAGFVFTPSVTTTYTLTASNSSTGCSNTASIVSGVSSLPPTPTVTTNNSSVCGGNNAVLTATIPTTGNGTIGIGTSLSTTSTYPTAFGNYWYQDWHQFMYTKTELEAAGLTAGSNITALKFNLGAVSSPATVNDYNIKIGTVPSGTTALTSTFTTTGLTNVYGPTATTSVVGLNTIAFSTPFLWDGNSNLLVDVRGSGTGIGSNAATYYTATTTSTARYARSTADNPAYYAGLPAATLSVNRPNITFVTNNSYNYSWTTPGSTTGGMPASAGIAAPTNSFIAVTPTASTQYYVVVSNAAGCTATSSVVVAYSDPSVGGAISNDATVCAGFNSVYLTLSGETGSVVRWQSSTSPTFATVTDIVNPTKILDLPTANLTTTTYYRAIVQNGLCVYAYSSYATITVNPRPVAPGVTTPVAYCQNDVAAPLAVTAASGNTVAWYDALTAGTALGSSVTPLTTTVGATTYYVEQINSFGCPNYPRTPIVVTINELPTATAGITLHACNTGSGSGSFNLTAAAASVGGANAVTWFSDAALTTAITSPYTSASTTVYAKVTEPAHNCSVSTPVTLTVDAVTAITTTPLAQNVCQGTTATFTVVATGTNLMYVWKKDGVVVTNGGNIIGATSATLSISNLTSSNGGFYNVVVTGTCGTVASVVDTSRLTVSLPPVVDPMTTIANVTVCAGNNAVLDASGLTITGDVVAPATDFTYQWKKGATALTNSATISGVTTRVLTLTGAAVADAGTYTLEITGACTPGTSTSATLTVNALPVANAGADVTINCTNTSASLTAAGGTSYAWSGGLGATATVSATPTATTTYTVTITSNGCTATDDVVVTVDKAAPMASAGADATINCTNTSASLTAAGGTSYAWSGGLAAIASVTATPTATTTYTVTVTAANGCSASDDVVVTVDNAAPSANAGSDVTVTCSSPSASLTATGGGTYNWSNTLGTTAAVSATPTATTTYTVTVTSANGCIATDDVVVTVDNIVTANAGADVTVTCSSPSASLTATGGASYVWSNTLGTTASVSATPTSTTTYTVTVTAVNGCIASDDVVVTVDNAAPMASAGGDATINCTNLSASLTATGGTSYAWSGGLAATASVTATPTATTTYTVTVTAANGCIATDDVVVTIDNAAPMASAGADATIDCTNTSASLTAAGGTSYTWSGGLAATASVTATPTATTTYTVTVTAANGCTATDDVVVTVDNTPLAAPGVSSPISYCLGGMASPLTATGTNLLWYDAATGGTSTTTAPTPTTTVAGTQYFWVSQTSGACESPRSQITVNVGGSLSLSVATTTVTVCYPATVNLATAPVITSSIPSGMTLAFSTFANMATPVSNPNSVGLSGTFYIQGTQGGCQTPIYSVQVAVKNPSISMSNVMSAVQDCEVDGFTTYTNNGNIYFGIDWNLDVTPGNAAAKAAATVGIAVNNSGMANAGQPWGATNSAASQSWFVMGRHWDVDLHGASLAGPVNVRFLYSQSEADMITNAANVYAGSLTPTPGTVTPFTWFKTNNGTQFNPNPGPGSHLSTNGLSNSFVLTNANPAPATNLWGGLRYAEFNGLTGFSGGTAAVAVNSASILPVQLTRFDGKKVGEQVKLTWTTASEYNSREFILEKSTDGINFKPMMSIPAAGTKKTESNYSRFDQNPANGYNYYRLKTVDKDGSYRYEEKTVVVNFAGDHTISIYPNPTAGDLTLNIDIEEDVAVKVNVLDMDGKLVRTFSYDLAKGSNIQTLDTSDLPGGTYTLQILNDNKEQLDLRRFVKIVR
jgi:hypothetical protein